MEKRLRVNPIECSGHGACAELLPEMISLDEWGYPILTDSELAPELIDHARRAASACWCAGRRLPPRCRAILRAGSRPILGLRSNTALK